MDRHYHSRLRRTAVDGSQPRTIKINTPGKIQTKPITPQTIAKQFAQDVRAGDLEFASIQQTHAALFKEIDAETACALPAQLADIDVAEQLYVMHKAMELALGKNAKVRPEASLTLGELVKEQRSSLEKTHLSLKLAADKQALRSHFLTLDNAAQDFVRYHYPQTQQQSR